MNEKQDKQITGSYLIALLAAVLHGEVPPPILPDLDLDFLYKMAARHSVANMACYGLSRLQPLPAPDKMKAFQDARHKALAREARQEIETRQILSALEEHHIKCMPLKGFIIKHLYPQPDMRLMADVDILVNHKQMKKAGDIMLSLGYITEHTGSHHDIYHKQPVMNIELHRALIPERTGTYFDNSWDRARLQAGSRYSYEMSNDDFYIYLLAHMAKHYRGGGTGIRSVMDVWVYNQHYKDQLNWNYINTELEKAGLHNFAQSMKALAESWFNPEVSDELYHEMTDFMLANGTYGTNQNASLNKFIQGKKDRDSFTAAKVKYTLRILFPDKRHMTIIFPFLQKLPFLLPLCWIIRGIRTVVYRRSNIRRNLSTISYLTKSKVEQMKRIQL